MDINIKLSDSCFSLKASQCRAKFVLPRPKQYPLKTNKYHHNQDCSFEINATNFDFFQTCTDFYDKLFIQDSDQSNKIVLDMQRLAILILDNDQFCDVFLKFLEINDDLVRVLKQSQEFLEQLKIGINLRQFFFETDVYQEGSKYFFNILYYLSISWSDICLGSVLEIRCDVNNFFLA